MDVPKTIIFMGLILVVVGSITYFFPQSYKWIGKLPGDIRIVGEKSKIFIPIVSMILLSIIVSLLVNFGVWIFSKFK